MYKIYFYTRLYLISKSNLLKTCLSKLLFLIPPFRRKFDGLGEYPKQISTPHICDTFLKNSFCCPFCSHVAST